jgi:uncharacterized protein (TIGR02246 family)
VFTLAAGLACETDPVDVGSSTQLEASQAVVAGGSPEIQRLVAAQIAAWAAKDADAYAATYAADARFVTPVGGVLEGRDAIRAQHAFLFAGPFGPSTETLAIADIRFLTGTIAIVSLNGTLTGYVALPSGLRPTEPGVVRTIKTWVVVKLAGSWQIVTQHTTPVAPTS